MTMPKILKGFTLIELLVVISIIAILVAVGATNYQRATKLSRDARRKTDLEQIRQALETYRSENGSYPTTAAGTATLAPNYMTTVPVDPISPATYTYTRPTAATYTLCTTIESPSSAAYCVAQP